MVYLSEIVMALDDYSGFGSYVYDREKDRVEMLFDSLEPEVMEIQEAMEEDESGRFVTIYADSNLGYDAMVAFIQELPEDEIRSRLERAIHGKGAFRYFRDTVEDAGLLERWYGFRDGFFEDAAREWCEDHDVPIS